MNKIAVGCASLLALGTALAVETRIWTQADMASFDKGTLSGLSLSSEGKLTLAPAAKEVFDASTAFLSAVARDSKDTIYIGGGGLGGSTAKLFAVDSKGNAKTVAELDGIAIQAIAVDSMDRVYAATSPDGKVYRISAAGKTEVFYDPKAKYIWAMVFDRAGNLYVATGDQGEIHKVTPAGVGSVFFKTQETHARSLALDSNGNLIVGTEPSGLILRVGLTGAATGTTAVQGFVLYQAPKREITALAVAADGTIYAAGVGTKQATSPGGAQAAPPPAVSVVTPTPPAVAAANAARAGAALPSPSSSPAVAGGSEIYRIQSDGYARKVWTDSQDLVYALAVDARGRAIAGTGNRGYLYRIDSDHSYTRLRSLASMQVTGLLQAPDGTLYAITGDIGKLFAVGPNAEASGTYESDVLDANAFTYWGRISLLPKGVSGVTIETRSGNLDRPQQNWSPWEKLNAGRIASPPARFLEYKATLTGSAEIDQVDVAYQMKNVAPVIQQVELTPENYKFPAPSTTAPSLSPPVLSLPQIGKRSSGSGNPASSSSSSTPSLTWSKGFIGARWQAEDDNGDALVYTAEIRGVIETGWKLIRDKIHENYVSWDSTAFPDGRYIVRITASDSPSNPPYQALSASCESEPFLIDNTPPDITGLTAAPSAGKVAIRFHAKDALSNLSKAEYSINGGDWMVVEPTTRLTDSMEEDYSVEVDRGSGEMTVAVRVSDEAENQAVAKTVVR